MTASFLTTAAATADQISNSQARLTRPANAQRADKLIRALRAQLADLTAVDSGTSQPRVFGYGLTLLETTRVFRQITSDGQLHLVDVISADEIDGVMAFLVDEAIVYPGDFPGQLRSNGEIFSGRFRSNGSKIRLSRGQAGQTADSLLVSQTDVTSTFVGTGLAYIYSSWTFIDGRFDGDPEISVIARMRKALDPRTGTRAWTFNPYVHLYDFLTKAKEIGGTGIDPDLINSERFISGANWSEMLVDVPNVTKTSLVSTTNNQNLGVAPINTNHLFEFDQSVVPFNYGDVVNIVPGSGQSLPANLSANRDYHVVPVRHRIGDFQIPAIALADSVADALAGNTIAQGQRNTPLNIVKVKETRHMSGFSYRSNQNPTTVLQAMLDSCGASLFLDDGKLSVTLTAFPQTVETVTEDDVFGAFAFTARLPPAERANEVTGSHTSLINLLVPKDYPVIDAGGIYKELDNDVSLPLRLDFPFIGKAGVAQRQATLQLRRLRQERTVSFSSDLQLYGLKPGSVFSIAKPSLGLDANTTFEVQDHTLFIDIADDKPLIGIDISGRQLEAATFDLNASDEQLVEEVRIPGLGSVFEVNSPGVPQVSESQFRTTNGGGVRVRVDITWTRPTGPFIKQFLVSYREDGDNAFTFLPVTPDLSIRINDLSPGTYKFRVAAINSVNIQSPPSEATGVDILGLSAPPSDPTGFTGEAAGVLAWLEWDRSPDLDVTVGGDVEIRHHSSTAGGNAGNSRFLTTVDGANATAQTPLLKGTYYIRFIDQDGNSSGFAEWSTQGVRSVPFGQLIVSGAFQANDTVEDQATIQEDPAFPSTNPDNTLVEDEINQWLTLPIEGGIDSVTNIDDVANIDLIPASNSVAPDGVYFFSSDVELTDVRRVRIEAEIETDVVDTAAGIDSISNIDNVPNIDAVGAGTAQVGQATAFLEVRVSRDTVASDTFGPWERVESRIFNHRSYQFRVRGKSFLETVNVRIKTLRVHMREVPSNQ